MTQDKIPLMGSTSLQGASIGAESTTSSVTFKIPEVLDDTDEFETKVETYRITKPCPKCKKGLMICTGNGFATFKTVWEHKCNKCDHYGSYENKRYPYEIFKEVGKPKKRK